MLAPIVLFVYNRPYHTQQTIDYLAKNELAINSLLFVFADGPKENASFEQLKKIQEVREIIHNITGFKGVFIEESDYNKGLANSVINGVSKVIDEYGKVIVVEDDIVSNRFFLRYMNEALEKYANHKELYCVGGANYQFQIPKSYRKNHDTYIVHRAETWGWGTWKRCWHDVDWNVSDFGVFEKSRREVRRFKRGGSDLFPMLQAQLNGEIDSWGIRWDYHLYKHNACCIRPCKSFVKNIGLDNTGVHCGTIAVDDFMAPLYDLPTYSVRFDDRLVLDRRIARSFKRFHGNGFMETIDEMKVKSKRLLKGFLRYVGIMK
ncbi:MAG: glycosyltransferase family 2 protein [Bacteroidales bacterium]|nr:glycosyltransferase family 2 protein [Bacteroidales bacterium]